MNYSRAQGWRMVMALALLLACLPGAAARADPLKVTGSLWSPYVDPDLPEGGLAVDLVRVALTRAGYEVEGRTETWPRAFQGTSIGLYDVVAAIWQNPAREKDLVFSDAYLLNDIVFLTRRGQGFPYQGVFDLIGKRIGVIREYAYLDEFDHNPDLIKVTNNHLIQNLLLLQQGKLDVVVGDRWAVLYEISRYMPDDKDRYQLLPTPMVRRALRLGVSRENPQAKKIAADFDAAIAAMRKEGVYARIVGKHTNGISILESGP